MDGQALLVLCKCCAQSLLAIGSLQAALVYQKPEALFHVKGGGDTVLRLFTKFPAMTLLTHTLLSFFKTSSLLPFLPLPFFYHWN
jgi:hypothetical protein